MGGAWVSLFESPEGCGDPCSGAKPPGAGVTPVLNVKLSNLAFFVWSFLSLPSNPSRRKKNLSPVQHEPAAQPACVAVLQPV